MASKNVALQIHQMTVVQFDKQFPDETACRLYLQRNRWPDSVIRCPRCGNDKVHEHGQRAHHWNCYQCSPNGVGYRFSVLVGTIFENTNKPLREWFSRHAHDVDQQERHQRPANLSRDGFRLL